MNYFKTANVKMRTVDVETNIHQELGSDEEESAGEEANERSAGKRKIKKKKVEDEEFDRILKEMGIDSSKSKVQTKAESAETIDVVSDNKKRQVDPKIAKNLEE